MSSNDRQRQLEETLEGTVVVDAGPGTGKTRTIVERYVNLVSKPDVSPNDILMLTFTRNAAKEMNERIKTKLIEKGMIRESKYVMAKTFDSFCSHIVSDNSEKVGEFFGMKEKLTRGARLEENQTLNSIFFRRFFDGFLNDFGEDYGDTAVILSQYPGELNELINRLMSLGIAPLREGWFGMDAEHILKGNMNECEHLLKTSESDQIKKLLKFAKDYPDDIVSMPEVTEDAIGDIIHDAVFKDRTELLSFVHDVYYHYIRTCITEGRLTFGLNALFAFILLYSDDGIRERSSYKYVMVDEFQDTNANQMMISMMILSQPNLCVVGDWKQGIYGFRYVSIDNILHFGEKLRYLRHYLNEDRVRIRYQLPEEPVSIMFNINYRSSQVLIDDYFRSLTARSTKDEHLVRESIESKITKLTRDSDNYGDHTHIRYMKADDVQGEVDATIACVKDYLTGSDYRVIEKDGTSRMVRYGDIALICRKNKHCRMIHEDMLKAGIPAFLQGDVSIMNTREGKLLLAWLRFINDDNDIDGLFAIMADLNYPLSEMMEVKKDKKRIPVDLLQKRIRFRQYRRRVNRLITMVFDSYGLDNDITQAIITAVASAHRNSLLTIAEVISIIEEDIENDTTYPVEVSLDSSSVKIMSMHQSKGLEFPIVIIPFVDERTMPLQNSDKDVLSFHETTGVRCRKEIGEFDGYSKICRSWSEHLVKQSIETSYDEERRLMFVAMSRAKQYQTVIASKPSWFMKDLSNESYVPIPEPDDAKVQEGEGLIDMPVVTEYRTRPVKLPVHDIMFMGSDGTGSMSDERVDEVCYKGPAYGVRVHQEAQRIVNGWKVEHKYPELPYIQKVVDSASGADLVESEVACILPVPGTSVVLRGYIDMMAVYPDRIEIHDWKTDALAAKVDEYKVQLSVYAHAASQYYDKPARCFIHYVSREETVEFEPLALTMITERTERVLKERQQ